jgi:hypothetical protein
MPQGDFWDRLKKRLIEVSSAAADFTEEQAIVGKLKFDILNLKRKIDRDMHDIGSRVLDISRSSKPFNPLDDGEVRTLFESITDLEVLIERKKQEILQVSKEIRSRRTPGSRAAEPVAPNPTVVKPAAPVREKAKDKPKDKTKATSRPRAVKKAAQPAEPTEPGAEPAPKRGRGRPRKNPVKTD